MASVSKQHSMEGDSRKVLSVPTYQTKKAWIVDVLRNAILSGVYKPGQRLNQEEIARQLDVSMTPVREALTDLAAGGLVIYESHKGARVAENPLDGSVEWYTIRSVLEALAVELATPRLTTSDLSKLEELQERAVELVHRDQRAELPMLRDDFHQILYQASNSPRLCELINRMRTEAHWSSVINVPGRALQSIEEHAKILDALKARDSQRASSLMREHVANAGEMLRKFVDSKKLEGEVP